MNLPKTPNPNRKIDYLRLSVTDRCNLRCAYCMPSEGIEEVMPEELLSFEEILRLVRIFTALEVKKVRITGGEPLVRKGIVGLIESIAGINGIETVAMTTNGILLLEYASDLKKAGVQKLNISIDTLNEDKFKKITQRPYFHRVMDGIDKAKQTAFDVLKLNVVVMKGINDDEVHDFVEFAMSKNLIIRFIEFMDITPLWRKDLFVPIEKIKEACQKKFRLEYLNNPGPSPAQHYKVNGMPILGFIKTDQNNCNKCSRLRLTSVGSLKICLYENDGFSLKALLREGASDSKILNTVKNRIGLKKEVNYTDWEPTKMYMCSLGG